MYYVIQFYKPTSKDRKLEEKLKDKPALERWKRLIKKNGYEYNERDIKKVTGEKI
jgi:hypothetical protein